MLVAGLPPGTTVEVSAIHGDFQGTFTTPDGPLGGETETFESKVRLEMQGTGTLAGFSRTIELDAPTIIDTAPRNEGDSSQTFLTELRSLEADLAVSDPDFATLSVRAGSDHGLPSPGATTLTESSSFDVDSFFDISYEITFTGEVGGELEGLSGTSSGGVRMGTDPVRGLPSMTPLALTILAAALAAAALLYWTRSRGTNAIE